MGRTWQRAPVDRSSLELVVRRARPLLRRGSEARLAGALDELTQALVAWDEEEVSLLRDELPKPSSSAASLARVAMDHAGDPLAVLAAADHTDPRRSRVLLLLLGWCRYDPRGDIVGLAKRLLEGGSLHPDEPDSDALYALAVLIDACERGAWEPGEAPSDDAVRIGELLGLEGEGWTEVEPFNGWLQGEGDVAELVLPLD